VICSSSGGRITPVLFYALIAAYGVHCNKRLVEPLAQRRECRVEGREKPDDEATAPMARFMVYKFTAKVWLSVGR